MSQWLAGQVCVLLQEPNTPGEDPYACLTLMRLHPFLLPVNPSDAFHFYIKIILEISAASGQSMAQPQRKETHFHQQEPARGNTVGFVVLLGFFKQSNNLQIVTCAFNPKAWVS